jgi:arylsulfatase A-like enzyme
MPTILDLLGLEIPEEIQGESLLPLLEDGKPSTDYAVSETYQERGSLFKLSLIEGTRHLISGSGPGEEELFDLARDPGEARNLAAESPGPLAALERRLERWTETTPVRNVQDSMKLKAEDIEALKALGYLQ